MGNHLSGTLRLALSDQLELRGGQASQGIRSAGGLSGHPVAQFDLDD